MKVSVDADDLQTILDWARDHGAPPWSVDQSEPSGPWVRARVTLDVARRRAAHPGASVIIGDDGTLSLARGKPLGTRWDAITPAILGLDALMGEDLGNLAAADVLRAYLVEVLDRFGVDLHGDEDALFVAVIMATVFVQLARNGLDRGNTTPQVVSGVAHLAQSVVGALIPYLPPEARP